MKKRYSKTYKLNKTQNPSSLGFYSNADLENDADKGLIISQQIFEFEGQLFITCLIEINE